MKDWHDKAKENDGMLSAPEQNYYKHLDMVNKWKSVVYEEGSGQGERFMFCKGQHADYCVTLEEDPCTNLCSGPCNAA